MQSLRRYSLNVLNGNTRVLVSLRIEFHHHLLQDFDLMSTRADMSVNMDQQELVQDEN
jgi:hypothetical protein